MISGKSWWNRFVCTVHFLCRMCFVCLRNEGDWHTSLPIHADCWHARCHTISHYSQNMHNLKIAIQNLCILKVTTYWTQLLRSYSRQIHAINQMRTLYNRVHRFWPFLTKLSLSVRKRMSNSVKRQIFKRRYSFFGLFSAHLALKKKLERSASMSSHFCVCTGKHSIWQKHRKKIN